MTLSSSFKHSKHFIRQLRYLHHQLNEEQYGGGRRGKLNLGTSETINTPILILLLFSNAQCRRNCTLACSCECASLPRDVFSPTKPIRCVRNASETSTHVARWIICTSQRPTDNTTVYYVLKRFHMIWGVS